MTPPAPRRRAAVVTPSLLVATKIGEVAVDVFDQRHEHVAVTEKTNEKGVCTGKTR